MTGLHIAEELGKLALAAACGVLLTLFNARRRQKDPELTGSLKQAQVLLCVTGALMMIIIGDSLARAFGIAGAAGIIRFRTPVENPRDTISLFLLLGVGMACGLGSYWVAVLGTLFLCLLLTALDFLPESRPRRWVLELSAPGPIPVEQVESVLAAHADEFVLRQASLSPAPVLKYEVSLRQGLSLDYLNALLTDEAGGTLSVSWRDSAFKKDRKPAPAIAG
jgi:hypothetical protein